jgi:hypothetical protein
MKRFSLMSVAVLLMLIAVCACSGHKDNGPAPPFSQADLTGTWYVNILQTSATLSGSSEPGWIRGTATVSSSGTISIPIMETNLGTGPGPTNVVWTIDPWTGIISESSGTYPSGNPDFHGKLAANKQLIVGTATNQNATAPTMQLRVMQKLVSGVTYTTSDLTNKNFMMHQLASGINSDWGYASGSTNGSAIVTIPTLTTSTGTISGGGSIGTMSIHPGTGLVTMDTNTWFQGMMSPDKTYFVATETDRTNSDIYRLTIVQITGQTFSTSDMAGSWHVHGLIGGIPAWIYQSVSIDSLGIATITSQLTSMGTSTNLPSPATLTIDSGGNVTLISDPTFHGTLSSGKDMLVSTQTITDGGSFNMLGVILK